MEKYTDYAVEQIVNLCKIPSPSGFTFMATEYLIKTFEDLGFKPQYTRKKSVLVTLGGEGEHLVLAAHVDTLGAMVRAIKSNGRIRHTKIGGYPENNIENENVTVHTRSGKEFEATAYLTHPAVHVYRDVGSMVRNDQTVEIILDEKVSSKKDVEKLGIKVGDFISLDPRTRVTKQGFIKSRHLDDKASAGLLIALAKMIADKEITLSRKVSLLFTTYEEVGHGGSAGVPQDTVDMISVDMGAVGDDLTTDEFKVSICVKDSGGPYDYDLTNDLIKIAEDEKLEHALDIYPSYGSDVEATLRAGYDIRHGLIGPGVFASHSYERSHRSGVENTMKLLKTYISQ